MGEMGKAYQDGVIDLIGNVAMLELIVMSLQERIVVLEEKLG